MKELDKPASAYRLVCTHPSHGKEGWLLAADTYEKVTAMACYHILTQHREVWNMLQAVEKLSTGEAVAQESISRILKWIPNT